ncbi:hypothetical protein [Streptomyces rimosus]|uniref:hypothetical protein n=1 Tax=Streptomyces rimosus TaxID=1927 RepID=UPI00131B4EB8|nr:hypothetical protein [Streptomyces rimosus]
MDTTPTPAGRPLAVWKGLTVSYVTPWAGERNISRDHLLLDNGGLRYSDEHSEDRDPRGGLWERWDGTYGDGAPQFGPFNSERQHTAMEHLLCQVCARPADRTTKGYLFLEPGRATVSKLEGSRTVQPPLCLPCALIARAQCPRLRNYVALRARKPSVWGLYGTAYVSCPRLAQRPTSSLAVDRECSVAYGTPELPYVLGNQLVREYRRVTIVNLDEEAARHTA